MNGAKTDERNYYAESYIALIEAIIKETASIGKCQTVQSEWYHTIVIMKSSGFPLMCLKR